MTFVGKILVIVIMVFSLLFLAFSATVFMTEKNWKDETAKKQEEINKLRNDLTKVQGERDSVKNDLEASQKDKEASVAKLESDMKQLQDEVDRRQTEITKQRTAVETALENVRASQQETAAVVKERDTALEQLRQAQLQSNEFKEQQLELRDQIRILERELEVAKGNNKKLREDVVILSNVIQQNGLDPDPKHYKAIALAPTVEGEITRKGDNNQRFQISIGSDDGLVVGHELYVYRLQPKPEYLGKVRVQAVDSDQSVVSVIGSTPQGKKIEEGDIVSTKIGPRG